MFSLPLLVASVTRHRSCSLFNVGEEQAVVQKLAHVRGTVTSRGSSLSAEVLLDSVLTQKVLR